MKIRSQIALVALVALGVVPAAQAEAFGRQSVPQQATATRPDDRGGILGVGTASATAAVVALRATRPDDRAGRRAVATAPGSWGTHGTPGFDWGIAAIGAAAALALMLVLAAALAVRRRPRIVL